MREPYRGLGLRVEGLKSLKRSDIGSITGVTKGHTGGILGVKTLLMLAFLRNPKQWT